jgi:hypothetical protein
MRISDKNNIDNCLIVPVWDFFGRITQERNGEISSDPNLHYSQLTINAIDGSIINRQRGF